MQVNAREDRQREIIIKAVEKRTLIKTEEEETQKREEAPLSEAKAEAKVRLETEVRAVAVALAQYLRAELTAPKLTEAELAAAKLVNESRQQIS